MAGKISEMTAATSVALANEFEVLQSGANKRATLQMLKAGMGSVRAYLAGNWYYPFLALTPAATGVFSGTIRAIPFVVTDTITISDLGAYVTTIGSSGHTVQFAIYANDATTNRPIGAALCSTGNVAVDTTSAGAAAGFVSGSVTPVQLAPGIYWMATNSSNSIAILQGTTGPVLQSLVGSTALADMVVTAGTAYEYLAYTQTYGTWPTFVNTTGMTIAKNPSAPVLFYKVSAVP